MCDYSLAQLFVVQSRQSVEGTAAFERSDALVVFAFEEKPHFRPRGSSAFECGADEGFRGLWCRCEV